ncbi:MAG: BolA/IbaG family iron-sulfur metabolism protein [Gammaproteobacteria bacterium]
MQPEEIQAMIEAGLPGATHVSVSGDGTYFKAVVVSEEFAGKGKVQQHRMVYATLGDKMRADIHALSIQTFTPGDWEAAGSPVASSQ